MKNLRKDMLDLLPDWAKKHLRKYPGDINDYFAWQVIIRMINESSFCCFDNASYFFNKDKTQIVVITEHMGYHWFPWDHGEMDLDAHRMRRGAKEIEDAK